MIWKRETPAESHGRFRPRQVCSPRLAISGQVPTEINGITRNLSTGGVGLLCEAPLPANVVVRCDFIFPGSPMSIPTLLQVRWSDQVKTDGSYRLGLKFLF